MIYLQLFWTFFKIGLFTFGGGYAMLPLIQNEVLANGWLTLEQIVNFVAVSESTPGPFAVNIATYVGMITAGDSGTAAGLLGAACATLGVALPSFLIILIIARGYEKFRRNTIVEGAMTGLRPAVIGLIGSALYSIGTNVLFPTGAVITPVFWVSAGIFVPIAILAFRKKSPILLIGISAAAGIAAGYILKL